MNPIYHFLRAIYVQLPLSPTIKTRLKEYVYFVIPSLHPSGVLSQINSAESVEKTDYLQQTLIRRAKLLSFISPSTQDGLEFGPLFTPIVTKEESNGRVQYIDYLTAEELKEEHKNDSNVRVNEIVDIDYIWGDPPLIELVNGRYFDYVIASHVIEHIPDMLGWLREIAEILKDNGILSLAIPDKRFTFDLLRETTSAGALIESYLLRKRRPGPREIFDEFSLVVKVDKYKAWDKSLDKTRLERYHTLQSGFVAAQESLPPGRYINIHCIVVTPATFLDLLETASKLELFDYVVEEFYDTALNELEFIVSLKRIARDVSQGEKLNQQLESIERARRLVA